MILKLLPGVLHVVGRDLLCVSEEILLLTLVVGADQLNLEHSTPLVFVGEQEFQHLLGAHVAHVVAFTGGRGRLTTGGFILGLALAPVEALVERLAVLALLLSGLRANAIAALSDTGNRIAEDLVAALDGTFGFLLGEFRRVRLHNRAE